MKIPPPQSGMQKSFFTGLLMIQARFQILFLRCAPPLAVLLSMGAAAAAPWTPRGKSPQPSSFSAEAQEIRKPSGPSPEPSSFVMEAQEARSVKVRADSGALHFKKAKGPYKFRWEGPYKLQAEDGAIEIRAALKTPSGLARMIEKMTGKPPPSTASHTKLHVTGPGALPLSIFLQKGSVHVTGWKAPVFVLLEEGALQAVQSQGAWTVSMGRGSFRIDRFSGNINIRAFHLNMDLKAGRGEFQAQFNDGVLKTRESEGALIYTTDKGRTDLKNWKGRLQGKSLSGPLTASLIGEPSAEISSSMGDIRIRILKAAPRVKAFTKHGKIFAPKHLKKSFKGKSLTVEGRLKGSGARKGRILLQTEGGNIYIR